jgi:hypothetical protein
VESRHKPRAAEVGVTDYRISVYTIAAATTTVVETGDTCRDMQPLNAYESREDARENRRGTASYLNHTTEIDIFYSCVTFTHLD